MHLDRKRAVRGSGCVQVVPRLDGSRNRAALRVSAVDPVYNASPYDERCARSIVRQTLPLERYAAIFVDDGSTDACAGYLDDLAAAHPLAGDEPAIRREISRRTSR